MQSVLSEQLGVLGFSVTPNANLREWRVERLTDHVHPLSECPAAAATAEPIRTTTNAAATTTWPSVQRTDPDRRNSAVLHPGNDGAGHISLSHQYSRHYLVRGRLHGCRDWDAAVLGDRPMDRTRRRRGTDAGLHDRHRNCWGLWRKSLRPAWHLPCEYWQPERLPLRVLS